ncbi:hypothetical protein HNR22_000814 [Micromonospora jinlongensis]|uniref:Uncharacterized protein n=1 Tax=Micromonospora jinlongensis TaxID=1287877 RepID=A0A7Y9WWZ4_9ACTN|nr:hypothetical protein [Micromonospora jinlongensis]NYH41087.1 hypothetical protein [Micromonospora jinlongensis]
MLDDMGVLRSAVGDYRAAATAFGAAWRAEGDRIEGLPVDELCRIFDVDRIADQPIWLNTQALPSARVLPDGAYPLVWDKAETLLGYLSFAVGIPFNWRHQLPLFICEHIVFTFVLAGHNEGEIWRYQIGADDWNPVRAAPSLATLFTEWNRGFAANVYFHSPYDSWLHVGDAENDQRDPFDVLLERGLDPFSFPVDISQWSHGDLLRARQLECGVDVDRADAFESTEEVLFSIDRALSDLRR